VRQAANSSLERIWIGTPYLIPPRPMRRALRRAARRGVDVRLVVPAREGANRFLWYASRRHYASLLRAGARIFEFGPAFYHAKLSVVDRYAALVGSSNLDNLSWRRNAELDVLLLDQPTIEMVAACYLQDEAQAQEVTRRALGARGLWNRLMEAFAGVMDEWL
jgi:phosphatidylserine/phosphatidylglycerophosphate/cardiolipin synthase-like enzyme